MSSAKSPSARCAGLPRPRRPGTSSMRGTSGAIGRVPQAMDAGAYEVTAIAAPTDEERAPPYLWRFWRALPRRGKVSIYDRSWYGGVLVERVGGFCPAEDWQRGYSEINA